jgi:hypothetical protein
MGGEALLHVVGPVAEEERSGEEGERLEHAREVHTIG